MSDQLRVSELSEALAARAESFCRHYFPHGQKNGNYWNIGDVSGSKGKSLVIRLIASGGRKAGSWIDYAGCKDDYGDLIDLLQKHLGHSNLGDTLQEVKSFLGEMPSPAKSVKPTLSPAEGANERIERAKRLVKYSVPTYRTLASAYLLGRGIKRFGPALRFNKKVYIRGCSDKLEIHPALIAKITDDSGYLTGVARYILDPKTKKLADIENPKTVLGQLYGNAVRFETGHSTEELIAGEGLENVLSVGTALRDANLASCLTANHLGLFVPPKGIKRLWIARDNDKAGEEGALRLRERVEKMNIWVGEIIPNSNDFNNDLQVMGLDKFEVFIRSQID